MNNKWSDNYSQESEGMSGALVVVSASGGVLVLIGLFAIILRKRNPDERISTESTPVKPLTGPPSRTDGTKKVPSNIKGPPPKARVATPSSEIETAASLPESPEIRLSVPDYTQLPGGGDYHYEGSQTFYSGTHCGKWKQNTDQSFTRIE